MVMSAGNTIFKFKDVDRPNYRTGNIYEINLECAKEQSTVGTQLVLSVLIIITSLACNLQQLMSE